MAVGRRRSDDPDPGDRFRGLYAPDSEVDRLLAGTRLPLLPDHGPAAGPTTSCWPPPSCSPRSKPAPTPPRPAVPTSASVAWPGPSTWPPSTSRSCSSPWPPTSTRSSSACTATSRRRLPPPGQHRARPRAERRPRPAPAAAVPASAPPGRWSMAGSWSWRSRSPVPHPGPASARPGDRPPAGRRQAGPAGPVPGLADVDAPVDDSSTLERALATGQALVYVRQPNGGAGFSLAAAAARRAGLGVLLPTSPGSRRRRGRRLRPAAGPEARLRGCGVVAGPIEALADRGAAAVRALAEAPVRTLVLVGSRAWDPSWSRAVPLVVDAPVSTPLERRLILARAFEDDGRGRDSRGDRAGVSVPPGPEHLDRAAQAALHPGPGPRPGRAPRTTCWPAPGPRTRPGSSAWPAASSRAVGWADLVLPAQVLDPARELVARVRHRDRVLDEWGLAHGGSRGRGVNALFAGESGTGKTHVGRGAWPPSSASTST